MSQTKLLGLVVLLCAAAAACSDITPECLPIAETCNGIDDDCDGQVDNLEPLSCGTGACFREIIACVEGVSQVCDPTEGSSPETCDLVDNDCDGETDEGLTELSCGIGACLHTEPSCVEGVSQVCDPMAGASTEVCDDVDNDCNGETDDGLPFSFDGGAFRDDAGKFVGDACGTGACLGGVVVCAGPNSLECSASDAATAELCDGADNDCDGDTDEDFIGLTGDCGIGMCAGGVIECDPDDSTGTRCSTDSMPVDELCNALDDDCDGDTDEEFDLGAPCGTGACAGGIVECDASGQAVCSTDGLATADTQCDGVDQDCNGITDDDFASGGSMPFIDWDDTERYVGDDCGTGQCAGIVVCKDDAALECDGAEPGVDDHCDGVDNDCNGVVDDLFIPGGTTSFSLEDGTKLGLGEVCFDDGQSQGVVTCSSSGSALACSYSGACHALAPSQEIVAAADQQCGGGLIDCTDPSFTTLWETSCGCGPMLFIGEVVCSIGSCGTGTASDGTLVFGCSSVEMVDTCVAPILVDDTCNNIDEDCDGETDEHYTDDSSDSCTTKCTNGQEQTVCI